MPFDECALLPEEPTELGGVVLTEPAPEHELLRRGDGRDRVDLEKTELPDSAEHSACGAVEQLCADSDPACLLECDDPGADRRSVDASASAEDVEQRVDDARVEMRAGAGT